MKLAVDPCPVCEAQRLDAAVPAEMSAETVYRVLRAKLDRLATRVAILEDENRALRASSEVVA